MDTAYQNDLTEGKMPLYSIIFTRHVLYLGCGVHVLVNIMLAHRFVDHVCCNCLT